MLYASAKVDTVRCQGFNEVRPSIPIVWFIGKTGSLGRVKGDMKFPATTQFLMPRKIAVISRGAHPTGLQGEC